VVIDQLQQIQNPIRTVRNGCHLPYFASFRVPTWYKSCTENYAYRRRRKINNRIDQPWERKKNYIAEQRRGKRKYLLLGIINALLAGSRDWTNSRGQAVPLLSLWVARPLPASAGVDDDIGSNNPVIAMVNTREPCMGQHHSFHCYLIFINHPFINNDYRGKMTNQFQGILLALA
jgi:hypothetical protein